MPKKPTKRKKLPTIPKLKKKVWKVMSLYIRLRDSDEDDMCTCCTCGVRKPYKEMHAGHYIPKSLGLWIMFHEENTHAQCPGCNLFKHGNLHEYALFLEEKYGKRILQELSDIRNLPPMGTADARAFLLENLAYFTAQLKVEKIRHLIT